MISRSLNQYLRNWRTNSVRKPLILRGARQVGKTTLIKNFGLDFDQFMHFNLELSPDRQLFDTIEDINLLVQALFLQRNLSNSPEKSTLIFIDEIQESPNAIKQLRYFYEQHPDLYIIAAGSLLEHALSKVRSFPVGRVEYATLHPMNFVEFLGALEEQEALNELQRIPIADFAHHRLLQLFHQYAIIGGMPEIVQLYAHTRDFSLLAPIYNSLIRSYKDDVEKYALNKSEARIIRHVIDFAPQYADERIKFAGFGQSNYRSRDVGEAMRSLEQARLIQLIYPTTEVKPPAFPNLRRSPRLQLLDTGLMNYSLGIQRDLIGIQDLNDAHRGKVIQHLAIQELTSVHMAPEYKPVFWVREGTNTTSEVDMVFSSNRHLVPIEVKSGSSGTLRSLHQYIELCGHKYGVRLLANNFKVHDATTQNGTSFHLMNIPYYLGSKIPQYIDWFLNKY